jgi:SAM-dependent methyltransferase
MTDVTEAYSRRAAEYTDLLGSMDAVHDSDRQLVDTWFSGVAGRVVDAGCGPGQWTDHLSRLGVDVRGIDLVPAFVERARCAYPRVRFDLESIDDIDEPDGALGGLLAWYSTIHHSPARISAPLREFARVLSPGGRLLLGYFDGTAVEEFPHAVAPAYRWLAAALGDLLESAGFEIIETHRRTWQGHRPHGAIVCRRRPGQS